MAAMSTSVSVLVPCFNCSATLERAISSIYEQTVRPAEIILVNDASTDDTAQKIDALARGNDDSCIQVLTPDKNSGAGTAKNAAWENAKQPHIAFLAADDSWHPRKVELQYSWMREHPTVILSGHPCPRMSENS